METKEITKAIIAVMWEVNCIWKNTVVWKWNSAYKAVWDKDVKEAIRVSMIKNWLSILQIGVEWNIKIDRWEEEVTWNNETKIKTKQSVFTDVKTNYLLLHISWESIELAWYWQWVDAQDKGAGKATTYALKNTLINIFLIPTWEDTDNTHSNDIAVPQKNDDLPWFDDSNYDKLADLIWEWKIFTYSDVKKKYKISKANRAKLENIWIK